jgi:hypothetical protein
MRLSKLQNGHGVRQRLLLRLTRILTQSEPFDVVKTFSYRPEYFGRHFCDFGHAFGVQQSGPSANEIVWRLHRQFATVSLLNQRPPRGRVVPSRS